MSRVPDELMQRLHDANNAFAEASSKLRKPDELDSKQRSDFAASLRSAEKVVEDLENEITTFLRAQGQSASSTASGSMP
jgi:hypothetical protein